MTLGEKDFIPDLLYVDKDGVCEICTGQFGWGVDFYRDAITKAAYCATWLRNVGEYVKNINVKAYEELFEKVIKKNTGATSVQIVPNVDGLYGYIDHQSIEETGGLGLDIFKDFETVETFIFNKSSLLLISNDNL